MRRIRRVVRSASCRSASSLVWSLAHSSVRSSISPLAQLSCRAFLFDMDGVLVDSRSVVERTWRNWALRHGLDAEFMIHAAQGRRTSDTLRDVTPHLATQEEVDWLDGQELVDFEGVVAVPGAAEFIAQ